MKKSVVLVSLSVVTTYVQGMHEEKGRSLRTFPSMSELSRSDDKRTLDRKWLSEIVKMRADAKGLNAEREDGSTLLMSVVREASAQIVKILLRNPLVDVNAKNKEGDTALLIATRMKNIEKMRLLLGRGANVNAKNNNQESALEMVLKRRNNYDALKLLLRYKADTSSIKSNYDALKRTKSHDKLRKSQKDKSQKKEAWNQIERIQHEIEVEAGWLIPLVKNKKSSVKEIKEGLEKTWQEINAPMSTDGSPFLTACVMFDRLDVLEELLKYDGLNVDAKNDVGATASMFAAQTGHLESLKLLLEHGADVNCKDSKGVTPLMISAQNNHKEVVKMLIDYGADVNAKSNKDGLTALVSAAENGCHEIVELLIECGADVNAKIKDEITALMMAAQNGHKESVKTLINHGADVNAKNCKEMNALMMAAQNGHEETVELLINCGADINVKNNMDESTPLMLAIKRGYEKVAEQLLKCENIDVNAKNKNGITALRLAVGEDNEALVKLLLERKDIDVNTRDKDGCTTLMVAAQGSRKRITKLLLEHKDIDVNAKNKNGVTALMLSREGVVELLLNRKDIDVNAQNNTGITALTAAILGNRPEVAETLIKRGADVNIGDYDRVSALMFAARKGHASIVRMLLDKLDKPNETFAKQKDMHGSEKEADANIEYGGKNKAMNLVLAAEKDPSMSGIFLNRPVEISVKQRDIYGRTALFHAVDQDNLEIAELILGKYGKISLEELNERGLLGYSIKDIAKGKMKRLILKYLDKQKEETVDANETKRENTENRETERKNTINRNEEIAKIKEVNKIFLQKAAKGVIQDMDKLLNEDIEITEDSVTQAFHRAAINNSQEVINYLLDNVGYLDINSLDKDGNTALMLAAKNGNYDVVVNLIANGANINKENRKGKTALTLAAESGHADIMKYLCSVKVRERDLRKSLESINSSRVKSQNYNGIKQLLEDEIKKRQKDEDLAHAKTFRLNNIWSIYFNDKAEEDWENLRQSSLLMRVKYLLREMGINPYMRGATMGRVEPLKGNLEGLFSRRINDKHRLIYRLIDGSIYIVSILGHYDKMERLSTKELFKDISKKFKKIWKNNQLFNMQEIQQDFEQSSDDASMFEKTISSEKLSNHRVNDSKFSSKDRTLNM